MASDTKGRMKAIKEHFEKEAKSFDKNFFKVAPFYKEALEALISALTFKEDKKIRVVDLGCGTGNITKALMKRYPNASVVCVDLADNMIEMAKAKLERYKSVKYWTGDIRRFDYSGQYDAVISSLVLHHLEKKAKERFYRKVFNSLSRGSVFYIADFVLPSSDKMAAMYREKWKKFMRKNLSPLEVSNMIARHEHEDRPAELMFELDLLRETGFKNVDVVWKYYNFAVYGGEKGS